MKIKVEIEIDIPAGNYELTWHNLSSPGEPMDFNILQEALRRILADFTKQVGGEIKVEAPKTRKDN